MSSLVLCQLVLIDAQLVGLALIHLTPLPSLLLILLLFLDNSIILPVRGSKTFDKSMSILLSRLVDGVDNTIS